MRRNDRAVTDIHEIKDILESCKTCHLAMIDGDRPYVVPLSYGYDVAEQALTLYFHCAMEGRKIDILHKNNQVCFEMCIEGEPIFASEAPCDSGYYYSSVIGDGEAVFITDVEEKCDALSALMKRQAGIDVTFTQKQAEDVCVFKVVSNDFIGKRKPKRA